MRYGTMTRINGDQHWRDRWWYEPLYGSRARMYVDVYGLEQRWVSVQLEQVRLAPSDTNGTFEAVPLASSDLTTCRLGAPCATLDPVELSVLWSKWREQREMPIEDRQHTFARTRRKLPAKRDPKRPPWWEKWRAYCTARGWLKRGAIGAIGAIDEAATSEWLYAESFQLTQYADTLANR